MCTSIRVSLDLPQPLGPVSLRVPALPPGTPRSLRALALSADGGLADPVAYRPARVLLQDYTGVPVLADLAALRDAVAAGGGDPAALRLAAPADLVIDHSVVVTRWGEAGAAEANHEDELASNAERFAFLKWAGQAFDGLRVLPPGAGIVHQVNLELLSQVFRFTEGPEGAEARLDTVVGTDSHTTMAGALGVLAWGVGGVDALSALLGEALPMRRPRVVGLRLCGALAPGVTVTDLALRLAERLRAEGVVGAFVEVCGAGLDALSLTDRATLANMAPEYGATAVYFPVDDETLRWLGATGRDAAQRARVEAGARAAGLWRDDAEILHFDADVHLDLGEITPCVAGPRRPDERRALAALPSLLADAPAGLGGLPRAAVLIAAITSCTSTANLGLMVTAGLLARAAVARGLRPAPWVKTSLAPGSRVMPDALARAGLLAPLEALGFHVAGFGCTTCIGNSGPLAPSAEAAVAEGARGYAVLSGNRNFEGRIHPLVSGSFLASPPLVVAAALAGRLDLDLSAEALGLDAAGQPVFLRDLWPSPSEIAEAVQAAHRAEDYAARYSTAALRGGAGWQAVPAQSGPRFAWDRRSTFLAPPPMQPAATGPVRGAIALLILGDAVTTDQISPAGPIPADSPAGRWLRAQGEARLGTYGARRAQAEVLLRGAFGGATSLLCPDAGPGQTVLVGPDGLGEDRLSPWEAARAAEAMGAPRVLVAGARYGMGSSRDQAARVTAWLGVRAVLARSFEHIHRANLAAFGVLPLGLPPEIILRGRERFDLDVPDDLRPGGTVWVTATAPGEAARRFGAVALLETASEVEIWRAGGLLARAAKTARCNL